MNTTVLQRAAELSQQAKHFVYVTILKTEGSASRTRGSMIVESDGTLTGTIGGGETEVYAQSEALALLRSNTEYWYLRYNVRQGEVVDAGTVHLFLLACTSDERRHSFIQFGAWEKKGLNHVLGLQTKPEIAFLGLCEDGSVIGPANPVFIEKAQQVLTTSKGCYIDTSDWTCHLSLPIKTHTVLLIGGGHVNQAIATLAHFVRFPIQVVETRQAFATKELFPYAKQFAVAPTLTEALEQVNISKTTACVIASHALDEEAIRFLLEKQVAYLGVLGSRYKAKKLYTSLTTAGKSVSNLFCPIGLDLESETPEEIAVSVIAEIMKIFNGSTGQSLRNQSRRIVLVRGGGDLATGVILRLHRSGYRVIVLETEQPSVIRTTVSLAQAMYTNTFEVEGIKAQRCSSVKEAFNVLDAKCIPILADPTMQCLKEINPFCIVDTIMAKRNLGTKVGDAPLVIALGPGFEAGKDADLVIETKRGHSLGRIIRTGSAIPDTGIPGLIEGFGEERVLHSPKAGVFTSNRTIGEIVTKGSIIAYVDDEPIIAPIDGKLRGLLNNGYHVSSHFKVADIDPRGEKADHLSVSEKAYAIAGGVLEAIDAFTNRA